MWQNLVYPLIFFLVFALLLWVLAGMPRPGRGMPRPGGRRPGLDPG